MTSNPTSNEITVSCLCGTVGCNAESCNPVTYKLAVTSRENRSLRAEIERLRADWELAKPQLDRLIHLENERVSLRAALEEAAFVLDTEAPVAARRARKALSGDGSTPETSVPLSTYESAVKGRQDFRAALVAERNKAIGLRTALEHAVRWGGPMAEAPRDSRPEWFDIARAALAATASSAEETSAPQGLAEQIEYARRQIDSWPDGVRVAMGLPGKASTQCQHDLLKPDTTIEVDGEHNAKCSICKTEWDTK